MPKPLVSLPADAPWLDLGSYARQGPGRRDRLSPAHIAVISRTVRRTPEVVIKMLNQGGRDVGSVARHLQYIDRGGELEIETDDGEPLKGKMAANTLIEDWGLDLDEKRRSAELKPRATGQEPKLVYKMIFSMPAGTPSEKVLAAVKTFAQEEFGARHRYAMVLHTDEPHPHVHMVVRAMGYDAQRLNIRKATLRDWRQQFARHLRAHGVAANATDRVVRGVTEPRKLDGIYRADLRRDSTHSRQRATIVARQLTIDGDVTPESGKARLLETRRQVVHGWTAIADDLVRQGEGQLAGAVRDFVKQMPPVSTEREWIRNRMVDDVRTRQGTLWRYMEAELKRIDVRLAARRTRQWRDTGGYTR